MEHQRQVQSHPPQIAGRSTYINNLNIDGNARVLLGDRYTHNDDLFGNGTDEDRREAFKRALYFEGRDLREQQISLANIDSASYEWVRESELDGWLASEDPIFWIEGKPGSGKSTLMKYLITSAWTRSRLRKGCAHKPRITYFFFDYRQGFSTANRIDGMMRQLVLHLSQDLDFHVLTEDKAGNLSANATHEERQIELIRRGLAEKNLVGASVCAFIDGLDEYTSDLWELTECLDKLQIRTGIRLCLASRPEPAFRHYFRDRPSLRMQDHNRMSITSYIHRQVAIHASRKLSIMDVFNSDLQISLVDKADGVILWAKLVTDEMLASCNVSTTTSELQSFLDSLPSEVELLYERLLQKLHPSGIGEAALLLHMLTEVGGSEDRTMFYQAWDFIRVNLLGAARSEQSDIDYEAYDSRLSILLGNMVDLTGETSYSSASVRFVHKTLSAYLSRSNWIADNFPEVIARRLGTSEPKFWDWIRTDVVRTAAAQHAFDPAMRQQLSRNLGKQYSLQDCRNFVCSEWQPWFDLLLSTAFTLFYILEHLDHRNKNISNILLLHCLVCPYCADYPASIPLSRSLWIFDRADALNIAVATVHGRYDTLPSFDTMNLMEPTLTTNVLELVLFSNWQPRRSADFLEVLAAKGYFVSGWNLCDIKHVWETYGMAQLWLKAFQLRQTPVDIHQHATRCKYRDTNLSLAVHWRSGLITSSDWEMIFDSASIPLEDPCTTSSKSSLEACSTNERTEAYVVEDTPDAQLPSRHPQTSTKPRWFSLKNLRKRIRI